MSSSTHQIALKGVDRTGQAFQSVQARAIAAGGRIARVMGGAIAAAGAYVGFRAIKGGITELGNLSDMAMKAGTSVDTLTKSSLAFQIAGLNMPVEALAKSFQYLKKNTGEGGMDNFFKTAEAISKIEDPARRGAELIKNFGRSGLELQPLIDGGAEAIQKMQTLTEIMPGVSQAAANAGDAASDSLKLFGQGVHSLFLNVIGNMVGMWSEDFPGGVRAGALNAVNWLETFAKKAKAWIAKLGTELMAFGALFYDVFAVGPKQAWEIYEGTVMAADADFQKRIAAADNSREAYKAKLRTLDVDDLAGALGKRQQAAEVGEEIGAAAAKAAAKVSNELIMGGSNSAQKLSILGPSYQNEQRKHTDLLKKIEKNTAKSADENGESYAETDLGV